MTAALDRKAVGLAAAASAGGKALPIAAPQAGSVRIVRPGALGPAFWAHRPRALRFVGETYRPDAQPALVSDDPTAVAWLALRDDDLVVLGPHGEVPGYAAIVAAAAAVARDTGRLRLVASVRNDELERFEALQRLGFVVTEARLGALLSDDARPAAAGARFWGEIAVRDEWVLARAVGAR